MVDISREELLALNMYYHRPASELIFMRVAEHKVLHNKGKSNPMYGKSFSEETKRKISEAMKGKPGNAKGRHWNLSEETKKRMSEAQKGKFINRKDMSKKVLCIETGIIYESAKDVQRKTGINHGSISQACNGKLKTSGGYHWKFFIDKD